MVPAVRVRNDFDPIRSEGLESLSCVSKHPLQNTEGRAFPALFFVGFEEISPRNRQSILGNLFNGFFLNFL